MRTLHIVVLLHHHLSNTQEQFPGIVYKYNLPYAPTALDDAHAYLIKEEYMKPRDFGFEITEKGRIMINALISVPAPVLAYTMPKPA